MSRRSQAAAVGAALALLLVLTPVAFSPFSESIPEVGGGLTVPESSRLSWERAARTAQPDQSAGRDGGLQLVRQTLWRSGDTPAEVVVALPPTAIGDAAAELAVTVFRRVANRIEFLQTTEGRLRGAVLEVGRHPLAELATNPESPTVSVPIPLTTTRGGVYPVRVELRDTMGGDVSSVFVTYVVQLPESIEGTPLQVATVLPFHHELATNPDGSLSLPTSDALALAEVTDALAREPGVPLTLVPTPETVDALSATPTPGTPLAALAESVGGPDRTTLAMGYVPSQLSALNGDRRLTAEARRLLDRGRAVIETHLGVRPSRDVRLVDEILDSQALEQLADDRTEHLVVREAWLEPAGLTTTLTETFTLSAVARSDDERDALTAAGADEDLAEHFDAESDPVVAAHHLLADLAVVWFDRPGQSVARGLVVAPRRQTSLRAGLLAAYLAGLRASPVLEPVTIETFFETVPLGGSSRRPLVRSFADSDNDRMPTPSSTISAAAVRETRTRINGLVSMTAPDHPVVRQAERALMASLSLGLTTPQRREFLRGAQGVVGDQLAAVRLPPQRSVTLTAERGEIPITIESQLEYPAQVELRLSGGTLEFPDGDSVPVRLGRQNTTITVPVRARGAGTLPLRLELYSPNGALQVASVDYTVRLAAVPRLGVALSAGSGLFLLVWWVRHWRDQRSKRLVPA